MPSVLKWMSRRHQKEMNPDIFSEDDHLSMQEPVLSIFDVPYVSQDNVSLKMDIYRPPFDSESEAEHMTEKKSGSDSNTSPELLPVIILVHGGGMMVGHPRMERKVCEILAGKGFLVFAPGYRLITDADGFGELCDLTAGLDYAGRMLKKLGGDPDRVYLIGESAGAWLSLYCTAMMRSERIRSLMSFTPADIHIRGIVFVSGMFYTLQKDLIGLVYPQDLYGDKCKDPDFLAYMNPEHEEVIKSLPPVILTSSRADFLKKYTLDYARALKKAGHKYKLIYFPEKNRDLTHAFVTLEPDLPESGIVLDKICRMMQAHRAH